jgi:hypothetical protein
VTNASKAAPSIAPGTTTLGPMPSGVKVANHELVSQRPRSERRQGGWGVRIVEKDQGGRRDRGHLLPPRRPRRLIPFAGDHRFLSGQPSLANSRPMVVGLTRTHCSRAQRAQCAASVASGSAATWAASAA